MHTATITLFMGIISGVVQQLFSVIYHIDHSLGFQHTDVRTSRLLTTAAPMLLGCSDECHNLPVTHRHVDNELC